MATSLLTCGSLSSASFNHRPVMFRLTCRAARNTVIRILASESSEAISQRGSSSEISFESIQNALARRRLSVVELPNNFLSSWMDRSGCDLSVFDEIGRAHV